MERKKKHEVGIQYVEENNWAGNEKQCIWHHIDASVLLIMLSVKNILKQI